MHIGIGVGINFGGGIGSAPITLLSDNFNRGDTSPIGTPQIGTAPTTFVSAYGISSNQAYCSGDIAGSIALWETGQADFKYTVKVTGSYGGTNRSYPIVAFNGLDNSNFLQLNYSGNGTSFDLMKVDAGAFSTLQGGTAQTFTDGVQYTITVVCAGNFIVVSVNGVQKLSYTLAGVNTKYAAYTKVGFRYDKGGTPTSPARWDDLLVTT